MKKLVIVVLGSPNDAEGNLSTMGIERCQQALVEYARNPGAMILPTGGWGEHFNTTEHPHGFYVQKYLIAHGVPETQIFACVESTNTVEDAQLAKVIVGRHGITDFIVVTSDFHLPRAQFLFEREFPKLGLSFSASKTNLPGDDLARRKQHEERALAQLKQ